MLDAETKRRIDTARDILVGKVPDPKSQVEQITIALIYKFMDDMDNEAISFGGKATFFAPPKKTGKREIDEKQIDFSKYKWTKIFDTKVGGHEMLALYSEAIVNLNLNPNVPQLFRDIFKNAYLPYRDPETLKLFLKTINEFKYDHSEMLGDAFEYLLSVLGSQGDAGQFRTPRHIIDFIVEVLNPQKNESICDPACGTAGFLISSYKHILKQNSKKTKGDQLTPDDRNKMTKNFVGYDISPDMVRLSLVNMYLHGFAAPNIYEYDTLTSEDRWNEYFDIILANPPFMTPKGGIKPHKKFSIQANRSEVLFVDYIAEHIHPTKGRAGVIVPEGIIFQSATAYKALRKMVVEKNMLYAVVSLPAGIFNPYSGVKTSILLMDKTLAKKTDNILFVKIDNDGFDLGAQRKAIDNNDLAGCLELLQQYKSSLQNNTPFESDNKNVFVVQKEKVKGTGDYNLTVDRYRKNEVIQQGEYEIVKLSDVCEINPKKSEVKDLPDETLVSFVPMADLNENSMDFTPKEERKISEVIGGYTYFRDNDVLVAKVTPCFENGKAGVAKKLKNGIGFGSSEYYVLRCSEKVIPQYVYLLLRTEKFKREGKEQMTGTGGLQRVPKDFVSDFQIPLPPIHKQQQLFNNVAYQKLIDGARQVIANYKPQIDIDPSWEMVRLGDIFKLSSGKSMTQEKMKHGPYPVYGGNGVNGHHDEYFVEEPIIVIGRVGAYCGVVHVTQPKSWISDNGLYVTEYLREVNQDFLSILLTQLDLNQYAKVGGQPSISQATVYELSVPLPSLSIQQEIVNRIDQEQQLVNANKRLIQIFEQKIEDEIVKLWQAAPKEYILSEDKLALVAEE